MKTKEIYCKDCKQTLPSSAFTPYHQRPHPWGARCKSCVEKRNARCYRKVSEQRKASMRDYRRRTKQAVFDAYGHVCACCGETEELFLDIDHCDNDGAEHRRKNRLSAGNSFYIWLVKNNFPPNFQTLCSNCNRGKFRNGGVCPHQSHKDKQWLLQRK